MAGSVRHTPTRCTFRCTLFMVLCLQITFRLLNDPNFKKFESFQSNTNETYVNAKARQDIHSVTSYYIYSPIWKTIAQLKCLKSSTSTGLLITPLPYKPRTTTKFSILLCIMLSGDVQLNPGPSKCHSCKKSLKSNALILTCNDCNKSTHIKCARISRQEFNNTYRNLNVPWHCSNCSAPCGICHGDVLNDHKAIQCDHCLNWIHTQCCAIDDNEYKRLINSSCSWACPECNNFNFTNSFFRDTEIPTANPFYPLDSNSHNLNETTNNNTTNSKKAYRPKKRPNFRCILINCQSVKKKASDIEALNNLHNPDIICGTESWLDPSIKNGEIFPSNFNVFRKDRETDTTGGGYFKYQKMTSSQATYQT